MIVTKQVLRGVLGISGTRYEIPLYQRTYDWSKDQFDRLWSDVCDLAVARRNGTQEHFLGSLVLDSSSHAPGQATFLVVDGQQRLTTLTLLLAALRDVYRQEFPDKKDGNEIHDTILTHPYENEYPAHFRLWPTQADREAFVNILEEGGVAFANSNMTFAYKYFKDRINSLLALESEASIDEVKSAVLDGLRFVLIVAESDDNVYGIFESLNNTGLKLTQADLIRNYIFSRLADLSEAVYSTFWLPMQERLSRDDLAHLFWLQLTLLDTEVKKDDTFKKQSSRLASLSKLELKDEVKRFNQLSTLLELMRLPAKEADLGVRVQLQRLVDFGIESIDPLVLGLLSLRQDGLILNSQLADCLRVLESFLVRRLIVRAPHNALSRILMRAFSNVEPNRAAESLREYFSADNKDFASDERVADQILKVNFYRSGTTRQRKTFLAWLEGELAGNEPAELGKATIEHVLPQNLTASWKEELSDDLGEFQSPEALHEALVHSLANITLSGYNSKLSDNAFTVKKKMLLEKGNIELNKWIAGRERWRRTEIQDRGRFLAHLIARTWVPPIPDSATRQGAVGIDQITDVLARVPAGKWVTLGDVAERLEVSSESVRSILTHAPVPNGWRVLEADGRFPVPGEEAAFEIRHYVDGLAEEGVQFDATGLALPQYRWDLGARQHASTPALDYGSSMTGGPLKDFIDAATNRLTPGVSNGFAALMRKWIQDGRTVLVGADPDDSEILTAEIQSEELMPYISVRLTLANGLWLRIRPAEEFAQVDPSAPDAILALLS